MSTSAGGLSSAGGSRQRSRAGRGASRGKSTDVVGVEEGDPFPQPPSLSGGQDPGHYEVCKVGIWGIRG